MTGIYCIAVVVMMYEISRRIGTGAWVQLAASALLTAAIWRYHDSLSQVILVQLFVMCGLLGMVTLPLLREQEEPEPDAASWRPLHRLRSAPEEEIIAEFLRGEFYHSDFDRYRRDFKHLVEQPDLNHPHENTIRRALLFLRRGRLWRELPADTEWWEIELTSRDLARLQSFPRNEWKRFVGDGFYLTEMVGRIKAELTNGKQSPLLSKLGAIASDLHGNLVPDAVLLIGIDERHPLTIIEGNHRMAAAMLTMPEAAHRRFRFYCGLSPNMNSCCWYKIGLRSLTRYVRHAIPYPFRDSDFSAAQTLRQNLTEIETP